MIAALIHPEHVVRAWIDLGPMLRRAQAADQPNGRELVFGGGAQLWAIIDGSEPIGAVVTQLQGERCCIWQIAGSRMREWAALFVATVEGWARVLGCTALYGCGRRGWARIVEPLGFRRVADVDGRPTWEKEISYA
jgi:hypothetical protein